ncbi:MAG: hypothetical protein AAF399_17475 [Bacteroidota bacterium]
MNLFFHDELHPLQSVCERYAAEVAVRGTLNPAEGFAFEKRYADIWRGIQQSAALIQQLGVGAGKQVAIALPMIPESIEAFWGSMAVAETALVPLGLPESSFQEALIQLNPRVLIAPAPFPGVDWWDQIEAVRPELSNLTWILQVDLVSAYLGRMQRWKARTLLRRKGKAEPIPGQQMGDFLASRKKLSAEAVSWQGHDWQQWSGSRWMEWPQAEIQRQWEWWNQTLGRAEAPNCVWGEEVDSPFAIWSDWFFPFQQGGTVWIPGLVGLGGQSVQGHLAELLDGIPQTAGRLNQERWGNEQAQRGFPMTTQWLVSQGRSARTFALENAASVGITLSPEGLPLAWQEKEAVEPAWIPLWEKKETPIEGTSGLNRLEIKLSEETWFPSQQLTQGLEPPVFLGSWEQTLVYRDQLVCPASVERVIDSHPAVLTSVVVGKEEGDQGELPIAYMQLRPDQQAEPKEIYEFVKAKLPKHLLPRGIRIVDRWPLTPMGSIDRDHLTQLENQ